MSPRQCSLAGLHTPRITVLFFFLSDFILQDWKGVDVYAETTEDCEEDGVDAIQSLWHELVCHFTGMCVLMSAIKSKGASYFIRLACSSRKEYGS